MEEKKKQLLKLANEAKLCKKRIKRILSYPKSDSVKVNQNRAFKLMINSILLRQTKVQYSMVASQPIPPYNIGGVVASPCMVGEKRSEVIIVNKDKTIELLKQNQNDRANI